jgi:hypothetical protein
MSGTILHATLMSEKSSPTVCLPEPCLFKGPSGSRPSCLPRETSSDKVIDVGSYIL